MNLIIKTTLISLSFCYSCMNNKSFNDNKMKNCIYHLDDLLKLKKRNVGFNLTKSDSFILVDERNNDGIGNIYKFNLNKELVEYRFMNTKNSYSYLENFNSKENKGSPILLYEFTETKEKKMMLYVYYFGLFKEFELYLCKENKNKKIEVLKFDKFSNLYYSSILLKKYTLENARNINYTLKGTVTNCGKINEVNEIIKFQ